uniref:Isoform 5 of N-acetylneuraminate lyase n=1 Tax=Homo sapiens TaxID=9606 RepID=Q9BXD5-5
MAFPKKKLQGLVAATITPMTENGEINFSVIGQYVDYLVKEQGVKNIFVNGTTGEGLSLSVSERRQVAEEWVTKGKDKSNHHKLGTIRTTQSRQSSFRRQLKAWHSGSHL